jgi:hypothetical protein
MGNLYHSDLFDFVTLLLIRGIHMGEIPKLDWLIEFVKHAIVFQRTPLCYVPEDSSSQTAAMKTSDHIHKYFVYSSVNM